MQFEQNLFKIHRTITKAPVFLLVTIIIALIILIGLEIRDMNNMHPLRPLTDCLHKFYLEEEDRKITANKNISEMNGTIKNSSLLNQSTNHFSLSSLSNQKIHKSLILNQNTNNASQNNQSLKTNSTPPRYFLSDTTILNIYMKPQTEMKVNQCSYIFNPINSSNQHANFHLASNEYLLTLNSSLEFTQKHNFTTVQMTVPMLVDSKWMQWGFYDEEIIENQRYIQEMVGSLSELIKELRNESMLNISEQNSFLKDLIVYYHHNDLTNGLSAQNLINRIQSQSHSIFYKILLLNYLFYILFIASACVGLLVRFIFFLLVSMFLMVCNFGLRIQWGWLHQYLAIICRRYQLHRLTSLKFLIMFVGATFGMQLLLTIGAKLIVSKIISPLIPLFNDGYIIAFLKVLFGIEVFHYMFCRSRTSIKFFPIFSFLTSYGVGFWLWSHPFQHSLGVLNIYFLLTMITCVLFILIEKKIMSEEGLVGQFTPSVEKPRLLFYAGYDLSWEKSMPPIWTYFTRWFDFRHFNAKQRCLIDKDYQLLYGRLLGMNERQELPEELVPIADDEDSNIRVNNEMQLIEHSQV